MAQSNKDHGETDKTQCFQSTDLAHYVEVPVAARVRPRQPLRALRRGLLHPRAHAQLVALGRGLARGHAGEAGGAEHLGESKFMDSKMAGSVLIVS